MERVLGKKPFLKTLMILQNTRSITKAFLPSTMECLVAIEAGDGAGSGVIVSEDGLVLTAPRYRFHGENECKTKRWS